MEAIGMILMVIGGIGLAIGGIWLLIAIFSTGILWGLGSLFVPFVSLIWLILHWSEGWRPFVLQIVSAVIFAAGMMMSGTALPTS